MTSRCSTSRRNGSSRGTPPGSSRARAPLLARGLPRRPRRPAPPARPRRSDSRSAAARRRAHLPPRQGDRTPRASPRSPSSRRAARRAELARSLVAYQLMLDYLDGVSERPSDDPLANGLCLHRAFEVALDPDAAHADYYAHAPAREDGGYLRGADRDLPRAALRRCPPIAAARGALLRQARLCRESQALNHALRFVAVDRQLDEWAARTAAAVGPRAGLRVVGADRRRRGLLALRRRPARPRRDPGRRRGRRPPGRVRLLPLGQRPERPARLARRPRRGSRGRQPPAPLRLLRARRRAPRGDRLRRPRAGLGAARRRPARGDPRRDGGALSGPRGGLAPGPRADLARRLRRPRPARRARRSPSTSCAAAVAAAAPCSPRGARRAALVRYIPTESDARDAAKTR